MGLEHDWTRQDYMESLSARVCGEEVGLGSRLAPYIFLQFGLKPRKTQAWPLLPPGEVKVRGFTIRVWKIFHLTSFPLPQCREKLGGGRICWQ